VSNRRAVGQPLRHVGAKFGGGDLDHPPVAEERRPVLLDPALRVIERALPIRLVVVQHVLGRFIKCDPADFGIDRDATFDIALARSEHAARDGLILCPSALAHWSAVLVVLDPQVRRAVP
jgi:hypothetical protein